MGLAVFMSEIAPDLAGAGLLLSALAGRRELRQSVLRALLAMTMAWIAVNCLRRGFELPRPAALNLGWQWLEHGDSYGFPSHHASGAVACYCALVASPRLRSARVFAAIGLAIAVGIVWSRVYLGVHFPKDVLAGAAVGWAGAAAASWMAGSVEDRMRRRRVAALPFDLIETPADRSR